jgi:outer membrane immunogenic protein
MLRKFLMATVAASAMVGSAYAADLPSRRAPPPAYLPPVPIFTWTGFYVGVNAGGAFSANNNGVGNNGFVSIGGARPGFGGLAGFANNNNGSNARFIGGGQVGVNYQVNQFVFGVEGDGQVLTGGNNNNNFGGGGFGGNNNNTTFLGTVRGRAGVAFDRFLVYGTGGVAFAGNNNLPNTIFGINGAGAPAIFTSNNGNNGARVGFAAGAGVEYAFTNNWTVKVEYLYVDLGRRTRTYIDPATLTGFSFANRDRNHIVRAGLNYKFDWFGAPAPVVARY